MQHRNVLLELESFFERYLVTNSNSSGCETSVASYFYYSWVKKVAENHAPTELDILLPHWITNLDNYLFFSKKWGVWSTTKNGVDQVHFAKVLIRFDVMETFRLNPFPLLDFTVHDHWWKIRIACLVLFHATCWAFKWPNQNYKGGKQHSHSSFSKRRHRDRVTENFDIKRRQN